jgi:hypothetical protein
MPSEIKDQCTKLVDQYAQAVINFLIMDMSPDEICKALSLCDSKVKQLPKPVHVKLLKDAKGNNCYYIQIHGRFIASYLHIWKAFASNSYL